MAVKDWGWLRKIVIAIVREVLAPILIETLTKDRDAQQAVKAAALRGVPRMQ